MVDVVYFSSETAEPAVAVEPIVPDDKMKKDKVKEKNSDDWHDELLKTLDRKRKERYGTVHDEPLLPLFKERDGTAGDRTVSEPQERDGTASDGTVNDEPYDGKEHDGTAGDGTNNDSKEITKKRKKKSSDSDSDGGKERGTKKRKAKRRYVACIQSNESINQSINQSKTASAYA